MMNFFSFSVDRATLLIALCSAIHGCSRHCVADMRNLRQNDRTQKVEIYISVSSKITKKKNLLLSFDEQVADKVLRVIRNSVESFVVQIIVRSCNIGESLGIVVSHERR